MIVIAARVRTRWILHNASPWRRAAMYPTIPPSMMQRIHNTSQHCEEEKKLSGDPRINDLGRAIEDDFATIRDTYGISIALYIQNDMLTVVLL